MTSPLRLRRDYGEDRVATESFDDSFESLFDNPPNRIPLPWGSPPKPSIWRAELYDLYYPCNYKITSPALKGDLFIRFNKLGVSTEITLYDNSKAIYIYRFLPTLYTVSKLLQLFWHRLNDRISTFKEEYLTLPRVASINLPAAEHLSNRPSTIPLPWGSPPKPNMWKAQYQGGSRYVVTSPLLSIAYTYILIINTKEETISFISFQDGVARDICNIRKFPQTFESSTLDTLLRIFWKRMWDKEKIKKYLTVPKVASPQRVPAIVSLSNLPNTLSLPWGSPPKPNMWNTKKVGDGFYIVTSPALNPNYTYTLQLRARSFEFSALLRKRNYSIYDYEWTLDDVEQDTLEELLESFWGYMRNSSNRHKKKKGINRYLTVLKVASSQDIQAAIALNDLPERLTLPWGNPPKPNMWSAEKWSEYQYIVTSPILDSNFGYLISINHNVSYYIFTFNAFLNGNKDIIHRSYTHKRNLRKKSLNDLLKIFWTEMWELSLKNKNKLGTYLTVTKVASSSVLNKVASHKPTCINDIIKHKPKTFELAWGTPAKKNMWKVSLRSSVFLPLGENEIVYTIQSPALNPHLSITFLVNKVSVEITVRVGYSGDILLTYLKFIEKKFLNQSLDISTEAMWRHLILYDRIQEHLKLNIKVASTLSRIRDKQTYGLRSLSNPSSQTGLFFYPVQQHRSKRATRHAFYLNDTELNIMEWQGSEWFKVGGAVLKRQQSELLLRLLRTIANTVEKM